MFWTYFGGDVEYAWGEIGICHVEHNQLKEVGGHDRPTGFCGNWCIRKLDGCR